MSPIEHLLTPSLNKSQTIRPIHSAQAHFMVAFFGGPLSVCLFGLYSIYKSGTLKRYLFWYVTLFSLSILLLGFWSWVEIHGFPIEINEKIGGSDIRKWGNRIAGLILMGIIYLVQRPLFLVNNMKSERPSPWIPGILALVIGFFLNILFITGGLYVIA